MARIVKSVRIRRPAEEVFDFASDLANERVWNPDLQIVERLTPGALGVGTKYKTKWKQSPLMEATVREYDRPRRWTTETPSSTIDWVMHGEVARDGDASVLTVNADIQLKGFMRLISPIFMRMMKRQTAGNMERIRATLEAGAATPSATAR